MTPRTRYMVPFSRMRLLLGLRPDIDAPAPRRFADLCDAIRHLLLPVPFDEARYLEAYPDLAPTLHSGVFASASGHFVWRGYFENRKSFATDLIPAFASLRKTLKAIPRRGVLMVDISYDLLLDLVRQILPAIPVDEAWYCERYADVAAAIDAAHWKSGAHHFRTDGYFEGRWPFPMAVDEPWYFSAYRDLRAAREADPSLSAAEHFAVAGYAEGRLPTRDSLSPLVVLP